MQGSALVSRDAAVSFGCDSLEAPVSNQHSHCFNLSLLTSSACGHRFEPHLWLRWMPAVFASAPATRHTVSLRLRIKPQTVNETHRYRLVNVEYQVSFFCFWPCLVLSHIVSPRGTKWKKSPCGGGRKSQSHEASFCSLGLCRFEKRECKQFNTCQMNKWWAVCIPISHGRSGITPLERGPTCLCKENTVNILFPGFSLLLLIQATVMCELTWVTPEVSLCIS